MYRLLPRFKIRKIVLFYSGVSDLLSNGGLCNTTLCKSGASSKECSIIMGFDDFQGDEIRRKLVQNFMAKNENLRFVFD